MIAKRDNEENGTDYPCEWIYKVIGSDKESVHNAIAGTKPTADLCVISIVFLVSILYVFLLSYCSCSGCLYTILAEQNITQPNGCNFLCILR